MLTFDNVNYYYKKGQPILEGVSFQIDQGEFVAIVGANGSGKSTLAKLMDGLLLPKGGSVRYQELDTSKPEEVRKIRERIGLVFQNPEDQFITTSVKDEVLFGLENIRVPRQEMQRRVEEALQAVRMEAYAEATPHELSGGQKQRVAVAAILAMQPQVIIFDEATSMLDPLGRRQLVEVMRELNEQGMTIIHITHHMDEVLEAKRLLLLHQGRVEYDGEPLAFFETKPTKDYQLQYPFAVRVHQQLCKTAPLTSDWKEMIAALWSTS